MPDTGVLLESAVRQTGTQHGYLFAPTAAGAAYELVAATQGVAFDTPPVFAADSRLLRWLRVNDQALPVPDPDGVGEHLSDEDRHTLSRIGIRACLPLVVERHLVAMVGLAGSGQVESARLADADRLVREHADGIRRARQRSLEEARVRATYRSHQLSLTGQFAAVVAHEMRNPLAAVRSITQLVRDGKVPVPDRQRMLSEVIDEVDRIESVLTGLLQVSRPHDTELRVFDAGNVAVDAASFVTPYALRQGMTIDANVGLGGLPVIGRPRELRQVVINVLLNACQASTVGGRITLSTATTSAGDGAGAVAIRIRDRGVGIAPEQLPHVFEPFFTTKTNGTGLGLMFCRDVLKRSGGEISIESQLGRGTTVTLQLPLSEAPT